MITPVVVHDDDDDDGDVVDAVDVVYIFVCACVCVLQSAQITPVITSSTAANTNAPGLSMEEMEQQRSLEQQKEDEASARRQKELDELEKLGIDVKGLEAPSLDALEENSGAEIFLFFLHVSWLVGWLVAVVLKIQK